MTFTTYCSDEGLWWVHYTGCTCGVDPTDGHATADSVADAVTHTRAETRARHGDDGKFHVAICCEALIAVPEERREFWTARFGEIDYVPELDDDD
jgi:hypothetical protein